MTFIVTQGRSNRHKPPVRTTSCRLFTRAALMAYSAAAATKVDEREFTHEEAKKRRRGIHHDIGFCFRRSR